MTSRYPQARVDPLVEILHGVAVPDPYRWLEDAGSADTRAWVDAQNGFILLFQALNQENTAPWTTVQDVTIRNNEGAILKQAKMSLDKLRHQAFSTATTWPETAGQKGSLEFRVTGDSLGISALGLRFHPGGSFTSFHTLSNVDWVE